jgi:hypothetical protein
VVPRACLLACSLGIAACASAAVILAQEQRSGAEMLFNGINLDGWKPAPYAESGTIRVDQGAIILEPGKPLTGLVSTRANLPASRYELSYEAMRRDGRDFFAAATFPVGKSYITLVNGGWGNTVTGLSSINGSDASENETTTDQRYENGTWYRFRVWVTDQAIRCWVDDRQVALVLHAERQIGTRAEMHPCKPLGFAAWKSAGALRAIRIRPLSEPEIRETDQAASEDPPLTP